MIFARELQLSAGSRFIGSSAVLLAAAGFAFATVLVKTRGKQFDPVALPTLQMTIGVLPLTGIALITEDQSQLQFTRTAVACLLYPGLVGSAFAFVLMFWLIRRGCPYLHMRAKGSLASTQPRDERVLRKSCFRMNFRAKPRRGQ